MRISQSDWLGSSHSIVNDEKNFWFGSFSKPQIKALSIQISDGISMFSNYPFIQRGMSRLHRHPAREIYNRKSFRSNEEFTRCFSRFVHCVRTKGINRRKTVKKMRRHLHGFIRISFFFSLSLSLLLVLLFIYYIQFEFDTCYSIVDNNEFMKRTHLSMKTFTLTIISFHLFISNWNECEKETKKTWNNGKSYGKS